LRTIAGVQLPKDATSRTIVTFHVEQFLRGESNVLVFNVESHWNSRYILGYTLDYGVDKFIFVLGAVDLQDPGQAEMIAHVRRFLLESEAGLSGFETYLDALMTGFPGFATLPCIG
jgi:hypothetical protein